MSNLSQSMQHMMNLAKENEEFKTALSACQSNSEVLNLLSQHNIQATEEELKTFRSTMSSKELSDDDLEKAAGGWCIIDTDFGL